MQTLQGALRRGVASGQYIWMLVLGAAASAAVCWPFAFLAKQGEPVWWLQVAVLAIFYRALKGTGRNSAAFWQALFFATGWLCSTFWWLYIAMHRYGGLNGALAIAGVMALGAALALCYATTSVIWRAHSLVGPHQRALAFSAMWTVAEIVRGTWLTGFGWGAMGYAHTSGPLAVWAPIVGVYGITALAVWCAATATEILDAGLAQRLGLLLILSAGFVSPNLAFTESNGTLSTTLLQGNIPQDEKFDTGTGVPQALRWYADHLKPGRTDLVIAPETAIPLLPKDLPVGYLDAMQSNTGQSVLLTGIPLGDFNTGYSNSVIALKPGTSEVWRYDKHHLVPFGEFIPPYFKWFTRMMNIPLGDFNRGDVGQPSLEWKGQRIAANICYEDLFGEELGVRFRDPQLAPTIFANVSNLGWFGDTYAIDQHLQISRMRALEFQRPYLRATNTGTTAILDHQGNLVASSPRFTAAVLEGVVEGRTGITPYAWWVSRFGLWPLWALAAIIVGWTAVSARRRAS